MSDGGPNLVTGIAARLPEDRREAIINSFPERERGARVWGREMQGEGAVFTIPLDQIMHDRPPHSFPSYWPMAWGCDLSHGGLSSQSHPAAFVLAFHDPVADVIYIIEAFKLSQMLPVQHVARIKSNPAWDAPFLYGHDGSQSGNAQTGESLASMYRRLGLNFPQKHATFKEGGYSFERGIAEMEQRFALGKLLVAKHLHEWFLEYQNYHYADGKVEKRDDDLMSATRMLVMGIRHARALTPERRLGQRGASQLVRGHDCCPFCGKVHDGGC